MELILGFLAKLLALTVGKLIEAARQKELEKQAARAKDLAKHLESMMEAENTEEEILRRTAELNDARIKELSAGEKLRRIREWNARSLKTGV